MIPPPRSALISSAFFLAAAYLLHAVASLRLAATPSSSLQSNTRPSSLLSTTRPMAMNAATPSSSFQRNTRPFSLLPTRMAMSSATAETSTLMAYKGLSSDSFSHPLDLQTRKQLQKLPILPAVIRRVYSSVESTFTIDNLGSSIKVGPNQMPKLYNSLLKAMKILDLDTPVDIYVKQNPIPNAYTLAFMGKRPFIVIHTGLLDLLTEVEVSAVIGHELGHLKCEHGLWITLFNSIAEAVSSATARSLPLIPYALRDLSLQWQRSAELSCDRAALLVTEGDYRSVASVIMKLVGGSEKNEYSQNLSLDAFLAQADELEAETNKANARLGRLANTLSSRQRTHPLPLYRASELVRWAKSAQYEGIRARAVQIDVVL